MKNNDKYGDTAVDGAMYAYSQMKEDFTKAALRMANEASDPVKKAAGSLMAEWAGEAFNRWLGMLIRDKADINTNLLIDLVDRGFAVEVYGSPALNGNTWECRLSDPHSFQEYTWSTADTLGEAVRKAEQDVKDWWGINSPSELVEGEVIS